MRIRSFKCELEKDVTLEQNSIRYLWCVKFPNGLDCSNLEFLSMHTELDELEELDEIFKGMRKLKVLFLCNHKGKLPLSTMSFKTLTNLRCLILCNWELSDISFIRDMKKLQNLSLYECTLPSFLELQTDAVVTQLKNLKLLVLHECKMERNIFEEIKIPHLEELYIINSIEKWDDYNENAIIEFLKKFSVPQALQWYVIKLGSGDENRFSFHQRTLMLRYFHISNEAIKGLAQKAKVLLTANIQGGAKNIIPDIFQMEGGGMNELNKLEISCSEEIECLVDTSNHLSEVGTLFSNLLQLRIDTMDHLRVLWHGCLPPGGTFEKLEELYLSNCPRLISLFTYVIARSLVQLKILQISGCDELKHILADDDKMEKSHDEFKIGHPVQSLIFQNLQEVVVSRCGELKHVFSASIVGGLPQLKVLKIEYCNHLDQIIEDIVPSAHQDQKEPDEIIEEDENQHFLNPHVESNQLEFFPESTSGPSAPVVNHSSGLFTLSSLASLMIKSCPKLGSLFTASAAKTLTSLEKLIIQDCHGLKHILTHERVNKNQKENIAEDDHDFQSEISMFKRLKMLNISGCDLLQHIFPVSFVGGGLEKSNDMRNKETSNLKDLLSQNILEDNSCHQQQNNTQIELPALEELKLDCIPNIFSTAQNSSYHVRCPSLGKLSLEIGRYVGFFAINCSANASKARQWDYITIKISNSDSLHPVESVQYLPKQPQGLNLLIMHNIRELELKGFDKVKYLFNLSIASSMLLEILIIKECPGLEHIIDTSDGYERKNWDAIFPNLKTLSVYDCGQLEYMLGQYPLDNEDYKEIHIHFPALEILSLCNLPNFVSICATNSLSTTWPSLKKFMCDGCSCSQLLNDSINYLVVPMDAREPISTSSKDAQGIQNHFLTLPTLHIRNAKVEGIFCLNGHQTIGQQVSLRLEDLELTNLPLMSHIWVASKNSFTLKHLKTLKIKGCAKLEVIFPPSVLRCLPELARLDIRDCKELKQIINEEEVEDKKLSNLLSTQPCFPNLENLVVKECHKLKRLFSASASNDLPNLKFLNIDGAAELEEIIGSEQGASKNSSAFRNLNTLKIKGCAKLEVIFPSSVLRCLSELKLLEIRKCKDLKQIIEEDVEDKKLSNLLSPQGCFPKLAGLVVEQCNKLKHFYSISAFNDLPNLEVLIINGAVELEELIGCEQVKGDQIGKAKGELPKLKLLILMHLSNFRLGTELLNVKHRIVCNCPKLLLTSTTTLLELRENFPYRDFGNTGLFRRELRTMIAQINESDEVSTSSSTSELPSSQINEKSEKEFIGKVPGSEVLATATSTDSEQKDRPSPSPLDISQHETHSQELVDGQSMSESYLIDQQKPLGETETTVGIPQENDPMPENTSPFQMNQEDPSTSKSKPPSSQVNDNNQPILGSMAEMVSEHKQIESGTLVSKTDELLELERENERTSHLQSLEEKLSPISSPNMTKLVDEESSNEAGFPNQHALGETMNIEEIDKESIQKGPPSSEGATVKTLSAGVSISLGSGAATRTESSDRDILAQDFQVVEQDDKLNEGKSKTGIMPCQEIQIQEGLNLMDKQEGIGIVSNNNIDVSPDTCTRLGAYKHFVDLDDAQIALLAEAIAAYPHLWNACEKFSERFQAWVLKTLAEILFFLRNETAVSITPQRENEFHRLCDVAVQLGFERSWVDEMRRRVVARDPELEHAQARIEELLKRRNHLTQELHDIQNELKILNDFVDAQTKCFDFL